MTYFTDEKIGSLIKDGGWELVHSAVGGYLLRQKDDHHIKTAPFDLPVEVANKHLKSASERG